MFEPSYDYEHDYDDEPEDIDDDFGYDPYAGGPEMDDRDYPYDDGDSYYDW